MRRGLNGGDETWLQANGETGEAGVTGLVSIVIPTWNRSALLRETLGAILAQAYRPIEVIVVDDDSTDDTLAMVRGLAAEAPEGIQLSATHQEKAGGPAARNRGARQSRGEFIVFMDDDDLWNPTFLVESLNTLKRHSHAQLTYCPWRRFYQPANNFQLVVEPALGKMPSEAATLWQAMLMGWTWLLQSSVIRRTYVAATGPWQLSLAKSQDLDYKLRLAAGDGVAVNAANAAIFYRLHKKSVSGVMTPAKIQSYLRVLSETEATAKDRSDYPAVKSYLADFFWRHSYWLYSRGYLAEGGQTLRMAQRHDPEIGLRSGQSLSRKLHRAGLGRFAGTILFRLFQLRNLALGVRKAATEEMTSLPTHL